MLLLIQSTNNMKKPSSILIVFLATSVHLSAQTTRPNDLTPPPPPQPTVNEVCFPAIREEGP
jgi:hypothetical protein